VKPDLFKQLRAAQAGGVRVTIGPRVPERDGTMRRMPVPHDVDGLEIEPLEDASSADALVARRIEELALPTFPVDPADAFVCVHEDDAGAPRVVFVMNPTADDVTARVALRGARALVDVLTPDRDDARIAKARGAFGFEVPVPSRTVRMFAVEPPQK
jgi:beta-galactosidase